MAVIDDSKVRDAIYVGIKTPKAVSNQDDAKMRASHAVKLTSGFWLTFLVPLLQPFQYGWSTSQLNLNTFNNEEECNARPVVDGTCIMFPGHQKASWTLGTAKLVVSVWKPSY
ncbi:hypothetical protein PRIC2_008218 [Phytophthora ramorum]